MITILRKEINSFFSSLIGYIVIGLFLIVLGLLLWVFPDTSLLDTNYAGLDTLFDFAPLVFMFIIPAVTMRSFAEENQTGTIELLLTRPIKDWDIILGKFLASWTLIAMALLPTLIYFYSVYSLGSPIGNLDIGGTIGSYIGLLLLAAVFTSIGIFSSSLTTNQIVAFIIGVFLSFFFLWGFQYLSRLPIFVGKSDEFVQLLGIDAHYKSVSRGVLDSRDIIYFASVIFLFLFLTWNIIHYRKVGNRKSNPYITVGLTLGILFFINILASYLYSHIDLTEDRRFSLSKPTRKMLDSLPETIFVKVLLDGDFPAGFKRLQNETREMLERFRSVNSKVEYQFVNPTPKGMKPEEISKVREELAKDGIKPMNLRVVENSETKEQFIYPVAIVNRGNSKIVINLLENDVPNMSKEVILNNSVSLLEYKFANAIQRLFQNNRKIIAFTKGHGELTDLQTADLEKSLRQYYDVGRVSLDSVWQNINKVSVLVVAKPTEAFSEKDLFIIDQYIMHGGKVLWLIDKLTASLDSMSIAPKFVPNEWPINLDQMFFKYGFRIQPDLVLDLECSQIPLKVGQAGNAPQMEMFKWFYHPIVSPNSNHPIVKSLDRVNLQFPSSIDTIRTKTDIRKTILLASSPFTRTQMIPVEIGFEILRYQPDPTKFNKKNIPLALLLEGNFTSYYENRTTAEQIAELKNMGITYSPQSPETRMIVVSDGDIAKNDYDAARQTIIPLGFNRFEKYIYANKDFLLNSIEYLTDNNGIIEARSREVKLRLLNTVKARSEKLKWQLINLLIPIFLLGIFGWAFIYFRKERFGKIISNTKS